MFRLFLAGGNNRFISMEQMMDQEGRSTNLFCDLLLTLLVQPLSKTRKDRQQHPGIRGTMRILANRRTAGVDKGENGYG